MKAPSPIRIVPLRVEAIAPVAAPNLTYRGGPLLTSVQVWGDEWKEDPLAALMQLLNDFFESVVTSPLIDRLGE